MKFAYIRVSTATQNPDRQVRNITAAHSDIDEKNIYVEKFTGTKMNRPVWDKLVRFNGNGELSGLVRSGDTIIFDAVDRMSRNADEGMTVYEQLFDSGVNLIFLRNPNVNTDVYRQQISKQLPTICTGDSKTDCLVNTIMAAVRKFAVDLAKEQVRIEFERAQGEVEKLHQRTSEGMETARRNGKQIGQKSGAKLETKKSVAAKEIIRKRYRQFGGDLTGDDCIKIAGISPNSFYKYVSEIKAQMEVE